MISFKKLYKAFITGLATVFPVLATFFLLFWSVSKIESFFGGILQKILPEDFYLPGVGIIVGILFILAVGFLMDAWIIRAVIRKMENLIYSVPLVKSVYGAIRDFIRFLTKGKDEGPRQVVIVTLEKLNLKLFGIVTRKSMTSISDKIDPNLIAVFIPLSYQVGGYTIMVPRSSVEYLDIPLDRAMRFIMTAGVVEK